MKYIIAIALILSIIVIGTAFAQEDGPLNIPIKTLYSAPFEGADVVYDIPVDVTLLDVSLDGNWHKVKISYGLGPISYTYIGWTKIPINQIITDREKEPSKIALNSLH